MRKLFLGSKGLTCGTGFRLVLRRCLWVRGANERDSNKAMSVNGQTSSVVLRGVSKRFDDLGAVDDLNLELSGGGFFTPLGPTGCRTTRTLRMIARLELPPAGGIPLEAANGAASA